MLIVTVILQKTVSHRVTKKSFSGNPDCFITGILQEFAAVPAISRSGVTMSALLLHKFDTEDSPLCLEECRKS